MGHLYSNDLYGAETYSQDTTGTAAGNGAYNEHTYNETTYNAAVLVLLLTETMTESDARTYVDSLTPMETVTIMEVLQRFFNGQILLDVLTLPDDLAKTAMLVKLDSATVADNQVVLTILKNLIETISMADLRTYVYTTSKVDAVNLADFLSKQITNKRVNETIKMNDWFTIKNAPQSDPWN